MNPEWTVVVPIFNEADSLERLLTEIARTPRKRGRYLIVDNGSTNRQVDSILRSYPIDGVDSIRLSVNRGLGGGIKFGLRHAFGTWVGWMPGNLKVLPQDLVRFDALFSNGDIDFIKAQRVGRSHSARLKTFIAGCSQSLVAGVNMLDSGGTPTFIRRELVGSILEGPDDYLFESYCLFTARRMGFRIERPKVPYRVRRFGSSHWQVSTYAELSLYGQMLRAALTWR